MLNQLKQHRRTRKVTKPRPITVDTFDRGKNTKSEDDKIRNDELSIAENVIFDRDNARVRPGTQTFVTDTTLLDIVLAKHKDGNKLFGIREDTAKSKISIIDRDTGVFTDLITAIDGQDNFSFTDGASFFYACNGTDTDIQVVKDDETTTTLAIPSGVPVANQWVNERLWVGDDNGNIHYSQKSDGEIAAFTVNNAYNTGGITSATLGAILGMRGSGIYCVVLGKDGFEVHTAPEFVGGETTFGNEPRTLVATHPGYGVTSEKAAWVVGGYLFFSNESGSYRYLVGSLKSPELLDYNMGEHRDLDFDGAAVVYHELWNTIYTAAKLNSTINNRIIAYKIENIADERFNAFSNFNQVDVKSWAGDDANLYYLEEATGIIKSMEGTNDDEDPIVGQIVGANIDNGDPHYKKKAGYMFADVQSDGQEDDITYSFWGDKRDRTTEPADFTFGITIDSISAGMATHHGGLGVTPLGLVGYDGVAGKREIVRQNRKINKKYTKGKCGISFSTVNVLEIRKMGWQALPTRQRAGNQQFI